MEAPGFLPAHMMLETSQSEEQDNETTQQNVYGASKVPDKYRIPYEEEDEHIESRQDDTKYKREQKQRVARATANSEDTHPRKAQILKLINQQLFSSEASDVEAAFSELADLCMNSTEQSDTNRKLIARLGGPLAIVKAMERHSTGEPFLHAEGCRAMANLALHTRYVKEIIADAEGIEAILAAMTQFISNEYIQECGCCALRNLTCGNETNKHRIVSVDGVPTIIASMKAHPTSASVLDSACGVLENLAMAAQGSRNSGETSIVNAVIDAGGTVALATAAKDHRDHPRIQEKVRSIMPLLLGINLSIPNSAGAASEPIDLVQGKCQNILKKIGKKMNE